MMLVVFTQTSEKAMIKSHEKAADQIKSPEHNKLPADVSGSIGLGQDCCG